MNELSPNPKYPRFDDWAEKLTVYIMDSRESNIVCDWERDNCASWAVEAVRLQNGRDLYGPFKGKTANPKKAYKAILDAGYNNLRALAGAYFKEKPLAFVKRGDLVLIPVKESEYERLGMECALGIADPPHFWNLGLEGLGTGLITEAATCFDIEEDA